MMIPMTTTMRSPVVLRLMEKGIQLPSRIWRQLNFAWFVFFAVMGSLNLYVAFNYSEATWVDFKLFGMLGLTFVFILAQGIYMSRFMPKDNEVED